MGLILVLVIVAITLSLAFVLGGVLIVILPIVAGLAILGWLVMAAVLRRGPGEPVRQADRDAFLGPGGPDDPDRVENA